MRVLAFIFLILTIAAVFLDIRAQGDESDLILRPLGQVWAEWFGPSSVALVETSVSRHVSPALAESVVQPILTTPAAIVFGIPFVVFYLLSGLFRRPRRAYNQEPV